MLQKIYDFFLQIKYPERYYLFTFTVSLQNGNLVTGNVWFPSKFFPSNSLIKHLARDVSGAPEEASIAIISIFEFKNRRDYSDFLLPQLLK